MRYCKECNRPTQMVIRNSDTKEVIRELDICYDCFFKGDMFVHPKKCVKFEDMNIEFKDE